MMGYKLQPLLDLSERLRITLHLDRVLCLLEQNLTLLLALRIEDCS